MSGNAAVLRKDIRIASDLIIGIPVIVLVTHAVAFRAAELIPLPFAVIALAVGRAVVRTEPLEYTLTLPVDRRELFGAKIGLAAAIVLAAGALSSLAGLFDVGPAIVDRVIGAFAGYKSAGPDSPREIRAGPETAAFGLFAQALFLWLDVTLRLPRAIDDEVVHFIAVGIAWIAIFSATFALCRAPFGLAAVPFALAAVLYAAACRRLARQEVTS